MGNLTMTMSNPTTSIIIPIYNAAPYLQRCLDSLVNQTVDDFEILAIDDGSTDDSLNFLNKYAKNDGRIRVFTKGNEGLSGTRNYGMERARGKYIVFVDADDWVETNLLDELLRFSQANNDASVLCSYYRDRPGSSLVKDFGLPKITIHRTQTEVRENLVRRMIGPVGRETSRPDLLHAFGSACMKLYVSEIIAKHSIRFVELRIIGASEDELFNIQYYMHVENAVILNTPLYHYWKGGSSNLTATYKPRLLGQWDALFDLIGASFNGHGSHTEFKKALDNRIALSVLGLGLNVCCSNKNPPRSAWGEELKKILANQKISSALKVFDLSPLPMHWKTYYFCAKHRLVLPMALLLRAMMRLVRFS